MSRTLGRAGGAGTEPGDREGAVKSIYQKPQPYINPVATPLSVGQIQRLRHAISSSPLRRLKAILNSIYALKPDLSAFTVLYSLGRQLVPKVL